MRQFISLCLSLGMALTSTAVAIEGFKEIKRIGNMTEYQLSSNGLTVLLQSDPSAAVVTYMVTYRVGSRNESYGTTGATHLLEHMMFKGTAKHNKEAGNGFDQLLESTGAETNATTWIDRTNYFTTLAPQHLPVIVELEADRMRNLRLREEDLKPEMTVVLNEFDVAENDPATTLMNSIWATAFQAHPYRHSVLGWLSDVENIPMEKLREFYQTYYWPNNATVSVVGNFSPDEALRIIKQHYAAIPSSPQPIPTVYTVEPEQTGPRRFTIKRPGELGMVMIAYKIPPALHKDSIALTVLCDLLADGLLSRFYQQLTEEGFTMDVTAYPELAIDPSLLLISAELAPDVTHQEVEEKLLDVIKTVIEKGVSDQEVAQAITRIKAQQAFDRDGSARISENLTEAIASGDWTQYHRWDAEIEKITAADLKRVAQTWLQNDQSTTGWYVASDADEPEEQAAIAEKSSASTGTNTRTKLILPSVPPYQQPKTLIAPKITRTRSGGIDLIHYPSKPDDVVTMIFSVPLVDFQNPMLATVMASMFERGTTTRSADQIATVLDETGAQMEFAIQDGALIVFIRCLKKNYATLIDLLAEQIQSPAFDRNEVELLCEQIISETAASRDDTEVQADIAFLQTALPIGHPQRLTNSEDSISALKKIKRKSLVNYHRKWITPDAASLIVVGDINATDCAKPVEFAFGKWHGSRQEKEIIKATPLDKAVEQFVEIDGKESISVRIGQASGLSASAPDYLPLEIATAALGSGFTSRLLSTVRDTEGLTYGISANLLGEGKSDGIWQINATFAPENLTQGIQSTMREINHWHQQGLSTEELAYHKSAWIGQHQMMFSSSETTAQAIHSTIQRGLPLTWLDERPSQINALSLEQVNEVLRRRIQPDRFITIQSGSKE